jgi:23S rRNA (adenine2503-C2)-methyltransferase
MLCHVNLIPINDTHREILSQAQKSSVKEFMEILKSNNINVTLRRKLGDDIMASCGQFKKKFHP